MIPISRCLLLGINNKSSFASVAADEEGIGKGRMRLTLKPLATILLLVSCAVTLAGLWPGLFEQLLQNGGFFPAQFLDKGTILPDSIFAISVWLTPFTAPFIHGSIFDLLLPGLLLLFLGGMVEDLLGWPGLLLLFITGILAATAAILIVAGDVSRPFFGSFNMVSAIVGAYLILRPNHAMPGWRGLSARNARKLQLLLLWLIINVVINVGPLDSLLINLVPTMASFTAGIMLAHPLLLWKYRKA